MPPSRATRGRVASETAAWLLAAWVAATLVAQHPQREFDRLRRIPVFRLILPDWRFFVPRPIEDDLVPHFRVMDGRAPGPWTRVHPRRERRLVDGIWFPDARRLHATIDICRELTLTGAIRSEDLDRSIPFVLLREAVRTHHGAAGDAIQIAIVAERPYARRSAPRVVWISPVAPLTPTPDAGSPA